MVCRLIDQAVLVVTWTTGATAERYYRVGQDTVGVDVWVTLVPEVQEACQGIPADRLTLRLQMLLGLPPRTESRTFVIMQAGMADLFRPCLDPDPTTPRCPVTFPSDAPVDTAYRAWIAEQVVARYQEPPDGYPWTRLGYTYDWHPDTPPYGASEYVLRRGAIVRVLDKQPTLAYCRPAASAGSSSD